MTTLLGDTVTVDFTTHDPTTGAAMSAGVLPTGVLVRNGVDTAEVVTVTNKAVGIYRAAVTIPAGYAAGDEVQIRIAATVNAIAGNAAVWGDTLDTVRSGEVATTIGVAGAGLTALGDARLANLDAAVSTRSVYAGGAVASVTGDVGGKVLGGGVSAITGTGARVVDAAGNNVAPAGTALSNATWTNPRAAALDNLDAAVSSRATAAQVWASAVRTLTDYCDVWACGTRTLTDYPGLIALLTNLIAARIWTNEEVQCDIAHIYMERYTTKLVTVTLRDSSNYPFDLTGYSIQWRAGSYLTKSTAAGTITVLAPATAGVFQFTITAADSLLLPYGSTSDGVEHECKIKSPAGAVYLAFSGRLRVDSTLIESM